MKKGVRKLLSERVIVIVRKGGKIVIVKVW